MIRHTVGAALMLTSLHGAAVDPDLARNLAATCTNCHGTEGRSKGGTDSLAGVPKQNILEKMRDFKSGDKPATIMHQISKGYTQEQLEMIAAWFAAQQP